MSLEFHKDEALLIMTAYYIYNAFVQALPLIDDVKNPWLKFIIRFAHGLAGNFGIFLWGPRKKTVVKQVKETSEHVAERLKELAEKGKPPGDGNGTD